MERKSIDFSPLKDLAKIKFGQMWFIAVVFFILAMGALVVGAILEFDLSFLPTLGILAIIFLGFYQGKQQAKKNEMALTKFATANSWKYLPSKMVSNKVGTIFSIGHGMFAQNIISGTLHNLPFETYTYVYTVSSGKNQQTYDLQVFELTLPRKLPHMVIDSLVESGNGSSSTLPIKFAESQKIDLEGDFSKYFSLYAPDSYGVTALTVLAPDAMEVLMNYAAKCDIEIVQNTLYFYWPDTASNQKAYEGMFTSVEKILEKTIDKLTTSDIYATEKQSNLHATATATGARLKARWWNRTITLSLLTIMIVVSGFISSALFNEDTAANINTLLIMLFIIGGVIALISEVIRVFSRKKKQRDLEKRIK